MGMLQLILFQARSGFREISTPLPSGDTSQRRCAHSCFTLEFRDSPQTGCLCQSFVGDGSRLLAEAGRGFRGGLGVGQGHGEMGPQGPHSPALSVLITSATPASGSEWFPSDWQAEEKNAEHRYQTRRLWVPVLPDYLVTLGMLHTHPGPGFPLYETSVRHFSMK